MRIELRKVSYNASLSQETSAFTADIGRKLPVRFQARPSDKRTSRSIGLTRAPTTKSAAGSGCGLHEPEPKHQACTLQRIARPNSAEPSPRSHAI